MAHVVVVAVPVKDPTRGKSRLRVDGDEGVETLIRDLAQGVLRAGAPRHTYLVGRGVDFDRWASDVGAIWFAVETGSLNGDLDAARAALDPDLFIVALGDLQQPEGLGVFDFVPDAVTLVPDHHGTGTSVLAVPRGHFDFQFGLNSAARHRAEAERQGLTLIELANSPWRFDLDEPIDRVIRGQE